MKDETNLAEQLEETAIVEQSAPTEGEELESGSDVKTEAPEPEKSDEEIEAIRERRRQEKKDRRERKRKRVEQLEAEKVEAETALSRIKEAGSGPKPQESDFEDFSEYVAAKAVWGVKSSERETAEASAQQAYEQTNKQYAAEIGQSYREAVEDARTRYQDFDAVALNENVPVSTELASMIMASDVGPDILYKLGGDFAQASRLSQLSQVNPIAAAREFGRMEASVTAPEPRRETKAPTPINPVKPSGGSTRDPANMTEQEFRQWREGGGSI